MGDGQQINSRRSAYAIEQIPEIFRGAYAKAQTGKCRPAAVKAMCQQCVGYENVTESVRNCTAVTCPLYEYRPYRVKRST